jgi:DNA-binding MurR/RpiR family transcriptional regulator
MKKIQRGAVSEVQASLELEKMKTAEWLLANVHQLCDSPGRELALLAGRSLAGCMR